MNRPAQYILLLLLLAGCASKGSVPEQAYQQGRVLLEQGKPEEGLAALKKGLDADPGNIELRSYYFLQRDNWLSKLLLQGNNARFAHRWQEAEAAYKRVLAIDENNLSALDGLKDAQKGVQRDEAITQARELLAANDAGGARDKLRPVLAEEPGNPDARTLYSQIEQKLAVSNSAAARLQPRFRKPVSLEFKDAPIKTVFEMLSKSSGINFMLDRDLRPDLKVSVFVKHTTIEDALQNILSTNQLARKIINENSVLIYPASKKADYEEMVVRTFYLSNVEPKQAETLLKTMVKVKDIFVDDKLNILVIRDSADVVRMAEKLLASYDLGDPEVLLEVEVLEVNSTKLEELGARYPNQMAVSVQGSQGKGKLTFNEIKNFNSNMGVVAFNDPSFVLNLLETEGVGKLLTNPRIRVKNHKKAKIHIGDKVPVITTTNTATGFSSGSVSYLDVGLQLEMEPSVKLNDEVSMDVNLEVSNIVKEVKSGDTLAYQIGSRKANTTLRLKNGETQVLAGLINDLERANTDKVPGLANLPIIGRLFRNERNQGDRTEIVMLITPRVVRNIAPPDASLVEFSTGTDSGNALPSGGRMESAAMPQPTPMPDMPEPEPMQPQPVPTQFQEDQGDAIPAGVPPAAPPRIPAIPPPPPLPVN